MDDFYDSAWIWLHAVFECPMSQPLDDFYEIQNRSSRYGQASREPLLS